MKNPQEEPKQECCQSVSGQYLGTTCPKCNKPFRSVIDKSKQETLEAAAEKLFPSCGNHLRKMAQKGFIEGAKYQAERMYNEQEASELVYNIIGQYANQVNIMIDGDIIDRLFEQFKKKA